MDKEKIYRVNELLRYINKAINKNIGYKMGIKRLNPSVMTILIILMDGPPRTLKELSHDVGLANSTVSGIVDKLVKEGYVMRVVDAEDRRRVMISLTEAAYKKREEIEMRYLKKIEGFLKDATDEDMDIVISGLNKLYEILKRSEK